VAFPVELLSKCWFLTGPTACGKTATSLLLAERINAEIVALDSMTLYRGMDIGTAKPSQDDRTRVRHHLIDILDPEDEFSLADYVAMAIDVCQAIIARDRTPLFVGGTGLYLRGLLRGVFEGPAADWQIRRRLEDRSREIGSVALHELLRQVDPVSADRLHPNDQRRVIRALEVFELTGRPLSAQQQQQPLPTEQQPKHVYWLSPPRDWLYGQINWRVEQMFASGLMDEVLRLLNRSKQLSHTARQALGYKEILDWLEADVPPRTRDRINGGEEVPTSRNLIETIQTRTRQFAKRQHTWFRNLEECRAIEITGVEAPQQIVDLILQ
jgi:tRNA dimethylallyltransferase